MTDEHNDRIEQLGTALWERAYEQKDQMTLGGAFAAAIIANPQAHIDALVAAGVLEREWVQPGRSISTQAYEPCYRVVTPKRVVRAGYRKCTESGWTWTCSEHDHGSGMEMGTSPALVRFATLHFAQLHADDQVEWADPPPKVAITYERDSYGEIAAQCLGHPYPWWGSGGPVFAQEWAKKHAADEHPDADVTYGPLPAPPHEHRLVWSGDDDGLPCVVCADGDLTPFYPQPYPAVGTPYSGPIPAHLQASPEELDTSQRAQRVKEG